MDEIAKIVKQKPPSDLLYIFSFCSRNSQVRKKRRREKALMDRSIELFESQLDVRNAVSTSVNLTLLTNLLLNEKQLMLFQRQNDRVVSSKD